MALSCNLKLNDKTYIERSGISGIDEKSFDAHASAFLETHERIPHIEEIPGTDSYPALKKELSLDNEGYTLAENIKNFTGKDTLREQTQVLNNKYTDHEITIKQTSGRYVRVTVNPRPRIFGKVDNTYVEPHYTESEHNMALDVMCNRISKIYGVNVHLVSTAAVEEMGVYDAIRAKGFVKDGEIFINSDLANIDTPMHELMHMIMGTLKAHNLDMYNKLCDMTTKIYDPEKMKTEYPGRTRRDVQEELFVSEAAKFIVGMSSEFDNLQKADFSEFAYLFNRSIDTIVNGRMSVNNGNIASMIASGSSFSDVAELFKSRILDGSATAILDNHAARLQRINSNKKEALIKKGILKEFCD